MLTSVSFALLREEVWISCRRRRKARTYFPWEISSTGRSYAARYGSFFFQSAKLIEAIFRARITRARLGAVPPSRSRS